MSLRVKKRVILFFLYLISIGLALMFLSPLLWMVVSSFKSETRIFSDLSSLKAFWPTEWIFDNYQTMQTRIDIVGNMITSLINGLIVGSLHFILNLLDGLDDVDLLLDHTVDSVKNFFTAFLNLGTSLFPFIPAEWLTIIEAALVILAIGVIIKRRVF